MASKEFDESGGRQSVEPNQERNSANSLLRRELETPTSGLNLLVAAVDAQDADIFRNLRPESTHSMDAGSSAASMSDPAGQNRDRDSVDLMIDNQSQNQSISESGSINGDSAQSCGSGGRRRSIPDTEKDINYWEKRRRNNEAAKRSREKRKMNDMAMESRLIELSKENSILKTELIHNVKPPAGRPTPVATTCLPHLPIAGVIAQAPISAPTIQTSSNSPFVPVKPEPRLQGPRVVSAPLGYAPPHVRAPPQAAAAETMLPNPPIPTNPLTGLNAGSGQAYLQAAQQQNSALSAAQPQSALAAALNANPANALPQSLLTAMLPPSALLQHLTAAYSQAQMTALLAAHQQQMQQQQRMAAVGGGVNGHHHSSVTMVTQSLPLYNGNQQNGHQGTGRAPAKQVSPDSTMERLLNLAASANPPTTSTATVSHPDINGNNDRNLASAGIDGKQYLRYKLLEKQQNNSKVRTASTQNSGQSPCLPITSMPSNAILGSLLTSGRIPLPTANAATEFPDSSVRETVINGVGKATNSDPANSSSLSVKQCLSSLAVHLASDPSTGSRNSDSSLTGSDGSQISPTSSHEGESNTSSVSQPSPPHAILSALGIGNGGESNNFRDSSVNSDSGVPKRHLNDSQRYMERRKRNNEAAKRCRANRRALFEYRFKRAQELEQENVHLKEEMQRLSRELMELKQLLLNKTGFNGISKPEQNPINTSETSPVSLNSSTNGHLASDISANQEQGGVSTPALSRDSGTEMSSESGNDENLHHVTPGESQSTQRNPERSLVIAENVAGGKMDES